MCLLVSFFLFCFSVPWSSGFCCFCNPNPKHNQNLKRCSKSSHFLRLMQPAHCWCQRRSYWGNKVVEVSWSLWPFFFFFPCSFSVLGAVGFEVFWSLTLRWAAKAAFCWNQGGNFFMIYKQIKVWETVEWVFPLTKMLPAIPFYQWGNKTSGWNWKKLNCLLTWVPTMHGRNGEQMLDIELSICSPLLTQSHTRIKTPKCQGKRKIKPQQLQQGVEEKKK